LQFLTAKILEISETYTVFAFYHGFLSGSAYPPSSLTSTLIQVGIAEANSWPIEKNCPVFDPGKWKRTFRGNLDGHLLFFSKATNKPLQATTTPAPFTEIRN
jgi:hypothetical protein